MHAHNNVHVMHTLTGRHCQTCTYLCMYNVCEHRYLSLSTPQQGTHKSLKENAKATATVSGIINGTGSLGKCVCGGGGSSIRGSLLECRCLPLTFSMY